MESISRPKEPGPKLGCFGALGLIAIFLPIKILDIFSLSHPLIPEDTQPWVLSAVCLGIPFLVSFLATWQSARLGQGILAGSLAAVIGLIGSLFTAMILAQLCLRPSSYGPSNAEWVAAFFILMGVTMGIPLGLAGTLAGSFLACAVQAFSRTRKEKFYASY